MIVTTTRSAFELRIDARAARRGAASPSAAPPTSGRARAAARPACWTSTPASARARCGGRRQSGALSRSIRECAARRRTCSVTRAALGLPRIALAERSALADQHEQRNPVQLRARDDAVDRREKAVVLHQHRGAARPPGTRPPKCPTPSSSFASRTSVISGSSSAIRMRCTSHVSGSADMRRTPHDLSAS